jgi:hypothetical protein
MAWRTLMTPIFAPAADEPAAPCARNAPAPKTQAATITKVQGTKVKGTAHCNVFRNDPGRAEANILEFTVFSFFRVA